MQIDPTLQSRLIWRTGN